MNHASDCATHNAPALPVGPCDCKPAKRNRQLVLHTDRATEERVKALAAAEDVSVSQLLERLVRLALHEIGR